MIYFVYIAENTHMNWRKFSDDYLSFSRKDRIGLLIIILIVIGVFFLPKAIHRNSTSATAIKDTAWIAAIKRLEQKNPEQTDRQYKEENSNYYQSLE